MKEVEIMPSLDFINEYLD